MTPSFRNMILLVLSLVACANATAALLFDGGVPDASGGFQITDSPSPGGIGSVPVADFMTDGVWRITDVEFWTLEHNEFFVWNGVLEYWIFDDDAGAPAGSPFDTYVATGVGQSVTKTMLGPNPDDTTDYNYKFALEQPVILSSDSRYWLGLRLGVDDPIVDNTQAFWHSTSTGFGSSSYYYVQDFITDTEGWVDIQTDLAFQLEGNVVPIPPALYLFGSGLLGLVGMARRKSA